MTQIIAPPFKVEFPEQLALSDLIDGTRTDVAASEKAVGALRAAVAGSSENLLINPRGKINQANEAQGVIAAGEYFCDGWKAGVNGAEVYVESDGFRLVSGSIVQRVPNTLEAGLSLYGAMRVVSGTPAISINSTGLTKTLSTEDEYIRFEVSGDNSKFTRLMLAESELPPIYEQSNDELTPCLVFYQTYKYISVQRFLATSAYAGGLVNVSLPVAMHNTPAILVMEMGGNAPSPALAAGLSNKNFRLKAQTDWTTGQYSVANVVLDCRP